MDNSKALWSQRVSYLVDVDVPAGTPITCKGMQIGEVVESMTVPEGYMVEGRVRKDFAWVLHALCN
jgi:hypothetical protein